MADELKLRFDRETMRFLQGKKSSGQYRSAQDYIRHLVRQEFTREQNQNSMWLRNQLRPGLQAAKDDFILLDTFAIIAEARRRRQKDAD